MAKKIFLNPIAAILELAAIAALKRKSKMETYQALLSTYRLRFSTMLHAINKKVKGVSYFRDVLLDHDLEEMN